MSRPRRFDTKLLGLILSQSKRGGVNSYPRARAVRAPFGGPEPSTMPPGPVASLPNRGAAFGAAKSPPFKPPATLRNTPSLATPHSYRLAKSLATASPPSRAPVVRPAPIACGDARSSAGAAPDHTPPPAAAPAGAPEPAAIRSCLCQVRHRTRDPPGRVQTPHTQTPQKLPPVASGTSGPASRIAATPRGGLWLPTFITSTQGL